MTDYPERPQRIKTSEPCTIARADGSAIHGTLLNLSNTGFSIGAKCTFLEGERLEMRILGLGRLKGTVRWAHKNRAGGALDV